MSDETTTLDAFKRKAIRIVADLVLEAFDNSTTEKPAHAEWLFSHLMIVGPLALTSMSDKKHIAENLLKAYSESFIALSHEISKIHKKTDGDKHDN